MASSTKDGGPVNLPVSFDLPNYLFFGDPIAFISLYTNLPRACILQSLEKLEKMGLIEVIPSSD